MPRYIVETALIAGVVVFVGISSSSGQLATGVVTVGVFLTGGVRIMASLLPLQSATTAIKHHAYEGELATELLDRQRALEAESSSAPAVPRRRKSRSRWTPRSRCVLDAVKFRYPGDEKDTLHGISVGARGRELRRHDRPVRCRQDHPRRPDPRPDRADQRLGHHRRGRAGRPARPRSRRWSPTCRRSRGWCRARSPRTSPSGSGRPTSTGRAARRGHRVRVPHRLRRDAARRRRDLGRRAGRLAERRPDPAHRPRARAVLASAAADPRRGDERSGRRIRGVHLREPAASCTAM